MSDAAHRYTVYGECLASAVPFPELAASASPTVRWSFRTTPQLAPMRAATELGEEQIYGEVFARLYAHDAGHRIIVDDTGSFDLSADRAQVVWEERATAWPDFVRAHLVGRVLATALYLDGLLPLHASAVESRDGVIAFLGPKGFGKSALALALAAAGARLVTDDTLPVELADPPAVAAGTGSRTGSRSTPRAWPGVHSVRVRDDVLSAAGVERPATETREGKRVVSALRPEQLMSRPSPLAALYLLDPVEGDTGSVTRVALQPMLAALGTVAHVKIGRMLGHAAAKPMLERAAAIARRVPVYRLHPPRDLSRLPETAAMILHWHGVPSR